MQFFSRSKYKWVDKLHARDIPGVVVFGDVKGDVAQFGRDNATELSLPWDQVRSDQSELAWLEWRTRLTNLVGRDLQKSELLAWAKEGTGIRAQLVFGEGGVGKTRLAAEVADQLRNEGWASGTVELDVPRATFTKDKGTLLIIDYPEENREPVQALLGRLSRVESSAPIRLLFLSRRGPEFWQADIDQARAGRFFQPHPMELGPLSDHDAYDLFLAARDEVPRKPGVEPQAVSKDAFSRWLTPTPTNLRPLFILAAAIHTVRHPDVSIVSISGSEIIDGLSRRELARLRNESEDHGLGAETLGRLVTFAAMQRRVDAAALRRLSEADLELGLPAPDQIVDAVRRTSCWLDGQVLAPKPDIVAASFVVKFLGAREDQAPEWLWAAIENDIPGGLERLGRLSHDAEVVLGLLAHRMSDWLVSAFEGHPDRCRQASPVVTEVTLPLGLMPLDVTVWQTLADVAKNDEQKAPFLNNLSTARASLGDAAGALGAIREAVEIYRRLAVASPARYEPDLASSLNNLSVRLGDVGDSAGALDAIREAVEFFRRLVAANPARYEPNLAASLNNLSNRMSDTGDAAGALEAVRESVEIRRRLASESPARYEPDLASSLNNLSVRLSGTGDSAGALDAIREAVEFFRRLVAANPARYEPDLAASLNNLSNRMSDTGDAAGALEAVREAVEIRRRLAAASPTRYEPDLAGSLSVLSDRLEERGQTEAAIEATEEALRRLRPHAEQYPDSEHGRRYRMMETDLARLTGRENRGTSNETE